MILPLCSGPNPPAGNSSSSSFWGPAGALGSLRFNTTASTIEMWDGSQWLAVTAAADPETWLEWFKYYINAGNIIADRYARRDYIQQEMQGRFPGNYRVELVSETWTMVFDTPADETWWHLKYD